MAAKPIPLLTLDEYLHTSYHPDLEFIDGLLQEKTVSGKPHSLLQMQLGFWFISHGRDWKIRVMSELRTQVSRSRVRLPDVCIVSENDDRSGEVQLTAPLIVIEILSPDDRAVRVVTRLDEYRQMGVEHIWLLDPIERAAFTYTANGLKLVQETRLTIPESPIYLDLPELFAALD